MTKTKDTYCNDPKHSIPCHQPCDACQTECDSRYLKKLEGADND